MKVLILGGDGYLGWPTTMHFANEGYEVYSIDNLSKRKIESEHGVEPLNIIKPFNETISGCPISSVISDSDRTYFSNVGSKCPASTIIVS